MRDLSGLYARRPPNLRLLSRMSMRAHHYLQRLIDRRNERRLPKWLGFGRHQAPFLGVSGPTARVRSNRLDPQGDTG